ncbi:MAG: hypothetical protein HY880_02270 [Deltaproteobacteria bacterium]|nr:hypothetical protein [Deltaproteobacteria bacterium]
MNPRERLTSVLNGNPVDQTPVMVPGGLIIMCPREVFEAGGVSQEHVHSSPEGLSALSIAMSELAGIDNLGLPFTMTVESEAYGGETETRSGCSASVEYEYPLNDISDFTRLESPLLCKGSRLPVAIEAIGLLRDRGSSFPIIGDLVGPFSLATSLIDEAILLKATLKSPCLVHDFLGFLVQNSIDYLKALGTAGADVFFITEPALRPELFGHSWFEEFSLPYMNRFVNASHALGAKAIVHVCGAMSALKPALAGLKADCLSIDSCVSIKDGLQAFDGRPIAGNICAGLLEKGSSAVVAAAAKNTIRHGASIVMPSCGLTGLARVENLRAMRGWPHYF